MRRIFFTASAAILTLSACQFSADSDDILHYELIGNSGEQIGEIELAENSDGVALTVKAKNITPGEHGIHFHENGSCETPSFKSAGGHINPMGKAHGLNNPEGPDNADMPNAVADKFNIVDYSYINARVSISGRDGLPALLDDNGSALVMHANRDDGKTQPIGGAGPRIACAVIR